MIRISSRQDEDGGGRRLFEGFEQAILGGLGHPLGVGQQRDAERRHERLQAQELLQRLVVRGRTPFGMKPDLVDADRLRPVVTPKVRVHLEPRWLSLAQQELFRQCARYGSFAYSLFTDEAKRMREPTGRLLGSHDADGPLMTCDGGESAHGRGCASTRSGCHCLATLTSLS